MKKIMVFAIPALLLTLVLTFVAIKSAYAWSAYAGAGFTDSGNNPRTYADAYASNYGLTNGTWEVYVRVLADHDKDGGWRFAVGNGTISAHRKLLGQNVSASAKSFVEGHKPDGSFVRVPASANHPGA